MNDIQQLTVNSIRVLSAEAIDKANSGHPGLPLGCAAIGYTLFANNLVHNPKDPKFVNHDRFVLSAGHGSMLLYSLLHLFGYGLTMDDLKSFRQVGSLTPGHPEHGHTVGVETSTGPLGQGIANAVGFAVAESMLAARFNKDDIKLVDHYTYALCGDGCMMEGIESEAASLAGTWKLGKLIVLYDSNHITIEGNTDIAFTEDVGKRHEAQGWQVLKVADGEDIDAINKAIKKAKKETEKPSLIIITTKIGHGSAKEGSADSHGAPLGSAVTEEMKKNLGYNYPPFTVPQEVYDHTAAIAAKLARVERKWKRLAREYKAKYPDDYAAFVAAMDGKLPDLADMDSLWEKPTKPDATRNSSGAVLNKIASLVPGLVGGAADLAPSTKTYLKGLGDYGAANRGGRNMHFGIREHAMSAITNGMQLHGGLTAFCSTFFVFSDYMKNGMRMSAIMDLPVIYTLTHDSIGVGEDGPTHQPIEQLAALRTMPNMRVFRPADYAETVAAYVTALKSKCPTSIVCSRQNLVQLENSGRDALRGGYIADDCDGKPDLILIATGSEVGLAIEAKKILAAEGKKVRVVSMPCCEIFDAQSAAYRDKVLPKSVRARVAVEAGCTQTWFRYVGLDGAVVGIDTFGESGPADKLMVKYGFTPEHVAEVARNL